MLICFRLLTDMTVTRGVFMWIRIAIFDAIWANCESNVKLIRNFAIQFVQLTYRPASTYQLAAIYVQNKLSLVSYYLVISFV